MNYLILILMICGLNAEARVFNMKEGRFAGYFAGTYGPSAIKKSFFEGESSSTNFSKGFNVNTGGEFGFLYNTDKFNWIFGFELIKPTKTSGNASTGSNIDYRYTSDISVFAPKLGLEIILHQSQKFRFIVNATVGTASLTTKTGYSALTIAPNTDFTIEGKGSGNLLAAGVGGEWHMSDNTTFFLQGHYRQLKFNKIKHTENVTSSFQGSADKGSAMTKLDGSHHSLDLSGLYAAMGFRFWLF